MNIEFNNERPIYIQLVDKIKTDIANGTLKPNTKLPSVRDLASLYKVNPNTILKSLNTLEEEKLIYPERTNGKYITDNVNKITSLKNNLAKEKVITYLSDMQKIGFTKEDAINYIKEKEINNGTIKN